MKQGFLELATDRFYYEISGRGEYIVFLHGFSLDHRMWEPQVEYFKEKYSVITYDLRGFGKSPVPSRPYSHYQDLHNLLKKLKINKAHIVGLSMGGRSCNRLCHSISCIC